MHILLVEDDAAYRAALTKAFEREGWTVTGVDRAETALTAIIHTSFDAVVCDFILPAREGTTLFETIREADPRLAERLLFVTGWANDTNARKLLEHTGRPVLQKPIDIAQLIATVKKIAGGGKK